jgi:hypothetical protein
VIIGCKLILEVNTLFYLTHPLSYWRRVGIGFHLILFKDREDRGEIAYLMA